MNTVLKERRLGSILVLMSRDKATFYIEAENDDFRVWRLTENREIAEEYYSRFVFWAWFIEAIPSTIFLKFATYLMRL